MKKPMSPSLVFDLKEDSKWSYEIKYDGYRCLLHWDQNYIALISKNGRSLNEQFPEVVLYLEEQQGKIQNLLPITLDGELTILENPYKSSFSLMQKRGRLKNEQTIQIKSKENPATYLAFDLLKLKGNDLSSSIYSKRKQQLKTLWSKLKFDEALIKLIENEDNLKKIKETMELYESEGIIAKLQSSKWEYGKSQKWLKLKNWRYISCFITGFEKENGFFHVGVLDEDKVRSIGLFKNGLSDEERNILLQTIRSNSSKKSKDFILIEPSICVKLKCLELYEDQLREPYFYSFIFDLTFEECTLKKLYEDLHPLPKDVEITNKEKLLWEDLQVNKVDYIRYLHFIAPYIQPFLENRPLTVIRYPNGIHNEAFYQKNCPEYAPDFVETTPLDDINFIVCNNLQTLLWLGNQGSIEFHIPFQRAGHVQPSDIILDLDPPSVDEFPLAITAARMIKEVCDSIHLKAFVKTSGGKGMQVCIPLPDDRYSYDETRLFTSFIADYLTTKEPKLFTTERMKNKRGKKLYVDYVQHAAGKTIIAPYSARANEKALISTPLFWDEVDEDLSPYSYSILNTQARLKEKGCPFSNYFLAKEEQPFDDILSFLKKQK